MTAHTSKHHAKPTNAPQCDDAAANIQRHRFFMQAPGIDTVATQLGVPHTYLIGLASYESGWLDEL